MKYILLDNFNGNINIILDEIGDTLIFDTIESAQGALEEECQNGQIIPLGVDVLTLINDCRNILHNVKVTSNYTVDMVDKLDKILGRNKNK